MLLLGDGTYEVIEPEHASTIELTCTVVLDETSLPENKRKELREFANGFVKQLADGVKRTLDSGVDKNLVKYFVNVRRYDDKQR